MDSANLDLYKIALCLCPLILISVSAPLIMFSAKVNPEMFRNHPRTHLVATEDVRNGFPLRAISIAVINIHADGLCDDSCGGGRRTFGRGLLKRSLRRCMIRMVGGWRGRFVCHWRWVNSVDVHRGEVWRRRSPLVRFCGMTVEIVSNCSLQII